MRTSLPLLTGLLALLLEGTSSGAEPTLQQCIRTSEDGQDRRREGKLRDAEALFDFCSSSSCPNPLRGDCIVRLTETRRAMPTLGFAAVDGRANPVASVKVTMEGTPLMLRSDGRFHVDPGEHTFEISADGHQPVLRKLVLREREERRENLVLRRVDGADVSDNAVATPLGLSPDAQRVGAYAIAGAGIIALGLGTYFGFASKGSYDDAKSGEAMCARSPTTCDRPEVEDAERRAGTQADFSTGFFITGAVLVAAGALLYFTIPKRSVATSVGPLRVQVGASW